MTGTPSKSSLAASLSSASRPVWSPQFHQVESMTVRISEIGTTEKSFILDLGRHPPSLELRHGSVEVLHLETDRNRRRRWGGFGLEVRMQGDDLPGASNSTHSFPYRTV